MGRARECLAMELGPHQGARALCLWAAGEREEALALVESLESNYPEPPADHFSPVLVAEDLAVFHGYTGDVDRALQWLETAYAASPTGVELRVLESELFSAVRSASRFQSAVDRLRGGLWARVEAAWIGPLQPPGTA